MRIRSLWQRLALWYTVMTLVIVASLDVAGRIVDYRLYRQLFTEARLAAWTESAADEIAPVVASGGPAVALRAVLVRQRTRFLERRVGLWSGLEFGIREASAETVRLQLFDAEGKLRGVAPEELQGTATFTARSLELRSGSRASKGEGDNIGSPRRRAVTDEESPGIVRVISPIMDGGRTIGTLALEVSAPFSWADFWNQTTDQYFAGIGIILLVVGFVGIAFGATTAWRVTRRLTRIAAAAEAWSRGDFKRKAEDTSADEIGQLALRLNRMSEDLRALMHIRQDLAAMEERQRIARDLHDSVKQHVFGLDMQIAAVRAQSRGLPALAADGLSNAAETLRALQLELGQLLCQLEPSSGSRVPLIDRLQEQTTRWARTYRLSASVEGSCPVEPSPEIARSLLMITGEALTNAARHSGCREVRVRADCRDGRLMVSVDDDGAGFDPGTVALGRGLSNMRARAATLPDGQLDIESALGGGTRVTTSVSLNPRQPAQSAVGTVEECP